MTKQYTIEEFIDKFVIEDTKNIALTHPYQAFALLSIAIEIIGKCFYKGDWESSRNILHGRCFTKAIDNCPELGKYRIFKKQSKQQVKKGSKKSKKKQNNPPVNELFHLLRCGMAHSLMPSTIILSPGNNDLKNNIIGFNEFFNDVSNAWESIKAGKTKIEKDLNEMVIEVADRENTTPLTASTFTGETVSETQIKFL